MIYNIKISTFAPIYLHNSTFTLTFASTKSSAHVA